MKKLRFLAAALLFISAYSNVSGQGNTILSNEFSYSTTFQYYAVPGTREFFSNYIIQEIARSIPKRPDYTSFTVNYTMVQKINKLDTTHYKVILELKNFAATGDVLYKGINISRKLIPGEIDYVLKIYRKQSGGLIANGSEGVLMLERNYSAVTLQDNLGYFPVLDLPLADTVKDAQYNLVIENTKLFFNERTKNAFINQMTLINDCYATDPVIAASLTKVQAINTSNIDLLSFYDIELKEVEQTIAGIDARQFPQNLNLWENDPMQFIPKMESLRQQTMQARAALNQRLSVLDQLFCQRGNELMAEGKLQDAASYYNKSLQINPYYAPAQYQLARMEFNSGMIDTSAVMVNHALLKMNPDPSTQQLLVQLGNTIYNTLNSTGEKYSTEQKFNEAIATFERARWLCSATPGMVCTEQVAKGLAQARYGIYHSYLQVAEKAIQNGRLDIAGNYINQSMDYQKQYSSEIISNNESINWMGILCKEYVKAGNTLNQTKKYDAALAEFGKADSISKLYTSIGEVPGLRQGLTASRNGKYQQLISDATGKLAADQIGEAEMLSQQAIDYQKMYASDITSNRDAVSMMSKVKEKRYNTAIASGKNQAKGGNHNEAIKAFIEARDYEKNYSFKRNDSLAIFIRQSGKPLVEKTLDEGKLHAWGNKLPEARISYQKASEEVILYGLEKDKDIESRMVELKNKIFSQECANAEASYKSLFEKARTHMRDGDYQAANDVFSQAIGITTQNILCNIDNKPAYAEQNRIKPAVEFQTMIKKADALAAQTNYTECIRQLESCITFHKTNRIDSFGLALPEIPTYIIRGNDPGFVYFAVEYYMNLKDYDTAFLMLSDLKKRNYPVKYTKNIQTQLGAKMAIRDKIAGASDYKIQILKYTEGESWYAVFSKSFKKTWKKN